MNLYRIVGKAEVPDTREDSDSNLKEVEVFVFLRAKDWVEADFKFIDHFRKQGYSTRIRSLEVVEGYIDI